MSDYRYGTIVQAIGPIVDVKFEKEHLPKLLTALKVELGDGNTLTIEVLQHIGDDIVRAVSMGATDGLVRGMRVQNTDAPISVPGRRTDVGAYVQCSRRSDRRHFAGSLRLLSSPSDSSRRAEI